MNKIKIGNRIIGNETPPYFIADIAANHDGEIDRAFKLIELAKESGADAAKFQNFNAKTIVSKKGFDNLGSTVSHQSTWKKSVYEVYEDASISMEWTCRLKEKCEEVGIEYMTTPYDMSSVDLVDKYLNAYKIGSGDITWIEIIKYISKKQKPVLLATGASNLKDVDRAVNCIKSYNNQIVIMQCNTNYTGSANNMHYINLNVLKEYRKRYPDVVLGLSDHTFGHVTVLGSIALGARVIEKHFTDDNNRVGPDHGFSMNPSTWRKMVNSALSLYEALGDGEKKIEDNEKETSILQRRALFLVNDLACGQMITKKDVFPLRPIQRDGIPPYEIDKIIGLKVNKDIKRDTYLKWEDFE